MSSPEKDKFYILNMFPYPSGNGLHMGHSLEYVASDIFARYKKNKFNVINPMGFDSFGLPAEQYAIQTGQHPAVTTKKNVEKFKEQLNQMLLDFDWDKTFCTSDPDYYKHTQRIFIWMFNSFFCLRDNKAHHIQELFDEFALHGNDGTFAFGTAQNFSAQEWNSFPDEEKHKISLKFRLAYQDDMVVNWCPALGTVLANDEVKNGFSERGGFPVEQKKMRQWCLRITAYAERLLQGLNVEIPKRIKFEMPLEPGVETKKKNGILAIIRHWEERDKFLLVQYKQVRYYALLTGGLEEGETPEEAVLREIREEVGYVNFKSVEKIDTVVEDHFYHPLKKINLHLEWQPFIVTLADGDQVETAQEEKDILEACWVKKNEVIEYLDTRNVEHKVPSHAWCFEQYEKLEEDFDWPESTKEIQRNWIGRSEGAKIFFQLANSQETFEIFTTRPETIFGVTFIAISQHHPLAQGKTLKENERGVFTGNYAIHPLTKETIPIWIADYVLSDYGTGCVMAVPDQDQRDKEFAQHCGLEVKKIYENDVFINSEFLDGLNVEDARKKIFEVLAERGIGEKKVNYKLRDAVFSRQRYWGEPIPVFYKNDLPYVFDEKDLPLELPDIKDFTPTGEPPLAKAENWTYHGSPIETTTMPGWAGSSWYFIRHLDNKNPDELVAKDIIDEWGKVDLYLGGVEHATGHLLYARFYSHFLYDIGKIPYKEPFKKLIHQGMVLGESAIAHRIENTNTFVSTELKDQYKTSEVHVASSLVDSKFCLDVAACKKWRPDFQDAEFILHNGKFQCEKVIEKMSKSKHNVANPEDIIAKYGVDTLRLYLMFLGPIEQQKPWNTQGIEGIVRFLNKVKNLRSKISDDREAKLQEEKILHKTIHDVGDAIERYSFNTGVSSMMICVNALAEQEQISSDSFKKFLRVLYPFAPQISSELLTELHCDDLSFPGFDETYLVEESFEYPIAINGKVRGKMNFNLDEDEETIKNSVLNGEILKKYAQGKEMKKIFVVKNKIINVVI